MKYHRGTIGITVLCKNKTKQVKTDKKNKIYQVIN